MSSVDKEIDIVSKIHQKFEKKTFINNNVHKINYNYFLSKAGKIIYFNFILTTPKNSNQSLFTEHNYVKNLNDAEILPTEKNLRKNLLYFKEKINPNTEEKICAIATFSVENIFFKKYDKSYKILLDIYLSRLVSFYKLSNYGILLLYYGYSYIKHAFKTDVELQNLLLDNYVNKHFFASLKFYPSIRAFQEHENNNYKKYFMADSTKPEQYFYDIEKFKESFKKQDFYFVLSFNDQSYKRSPYYRASGQTSYYKFLLDNSPNYFKMQDAILKKKGINAKGNNPQLYQYNTQQSYQYNRTIGKNRVFFDTQQHIDIEDIKNNIIKKYPNISFQKLDNFNESVNSIYNEYQIFNKYLRKKHQ